MIEFAQPWAALLLPIPIVVYYLAPPHRETLDALQVPYFEGLVAVSGKKPGAGASVLRRRRLQTVINSIAWCLLVAALAAPENVGPPVNVNKSARDLMLALDLSGSMEAKDISLDSDAPINRLTAAKAVLQDFAARRSGDRLGLIVFGNNAYLQSPFTDDLPTWSTLLDETEVAMAGQSTALGDAIGLAISLFQESATRNRVLVVLTDGNDTGSRVPPLDAAVIAAAEDVTIYTVAVGDPATIGEDALDLETLEDVAKSTGGATFQAQDGEALRDAYTRIDALEPAEYDTLSYRPRSRVFHWPLGAFALLYLLASPLFMVFGSSSRGARS